MKKKIITKVSAILLASTLSIPAMAQVKNAEQAISLLNQLSAIQSAVSAPRSDNELTIDQLSNRYAAEIKALKKRLNLKNVTIEKKENGEWFYVLHTKGKYPRMGIADSQGNVLIQPSYAQITYCPPIPEGNYKLGIVNGNQQYIYHDMRPAHFVATNDSYNSYWVGSGKQITTNKPTTIFDTNGKIIKNALESYRLAEMGPYYAINIFGLYQRGFNGTNVGLMTSMGEMLLEPCYTEILVEVDNPLFLILEQDVDGTRRKGAYSLKERRIVVPCLYTEIWHKKDGSWSVQKNKNDLVENFDPNTALKTIVYRDEGERYYDRLEYDKVIEYYSKAGAQAPWAKYFTGMAVLHDVYMADYNLSLFKIGLENYRGNTEFVYIDFDAARKKNNLAKQLFESYLQSGDEQYKKQADGEVSGHNYREEMLNESEQQYLSLVNLWKQYRAQAQAQAAAEQQRAREAYAAAFNVFGNMMNNIFSSIGGSSQSSQQNTVRSSGSSYTGSSSSSRSSSSSSGSEKVTMQEVHEKCSGSYCNNGACTKCGGTGRGTKLGMDNKCTYCDGTGKCTICKGKGYKVRWK